MNRPSLLSNKNQWLEEAVVPLDNPEGKHWNIKDGGCEGINHANASIVPTAYIHQNYELYKLYNKNFPVTSTGRYLGSLFDKNKYLR